MRHTPRTGRARALSLAGPRFPVRPVRRLPSALALLAWALVVPAATAQRLPVSNLTLEEGKTGSYKVALEEQPPIPVVVSIDHSGDSDVSAEPTSLTFTPEKWKQPQRVRVRSAPDPDSQNDRARFTHTIKPAIGKKQPVSVKITPPAIDVVVEDRSVNPELNLSPSSGLSIHKGNSATFTASLAVVQPTSSVSVSASSSQSSNGVTVSPSSGTVYPGSWTSGIVFTVSVSSSASATSASISVSTSSSDSNFQGLSDSLPITVLTASPTMSCSPASQTVDEGDNATLSWSSSNANSVSISPNPGVTGTIPLSGSHTWKPGATDTYRFTATGGGRTATDSCTVTVEPAEPEITVSQPSASVTVEVGETVTYWDATLSGNPGSHSVTVSSSETNAAIFLPTTSGTLTSSNYSTGVRFEVRGVAVTSSATITNSASAPAASNIDTSVRNTSVTVTEPPTPEGPTLACSAAASDVTLNGSTSVSWTSTNADTVTLNGTGVDKNGSQSVTPAAPGPGVTSKTTPYDFVAEGASGTTDATCSVSVTKWRPPTVDSFNASPSTISAGGFSKLSWSTTHATAASISPGVGSVALDQANPPGRSVSPNSTTIYTLTASNPAYSGDTDTVTVSIDEPDIALSASPSSVSEGGSSTITARVDAAVSSALTVSISKTGGTASSSDFSVGNITIYSGNDQGTTTFRAIQDTAVEGNETVTLRGSASGYDSGQTTLTLINTPVIGLNITPSAVSVTEGGANETYNVSLRTLPTDPVDVSVTFDADPDARARKDSETLRFLTSNWDTPQAVSVWAVEDNAGTPTDGSASIVHSTTSTDSDYDALSETVAVTVKEDDTAGCSATVHPTTVDITEGVAADGSYTVRLDQAPKLPVTVALALSGSVDVSADRSSVTLSPTDHGAKTVTVEAAEDTDWLDEVATVAHTASSGDEGCDGIDVSVVTVRVDDDEETPQITLTSDPMGVAEPDGAATLTASLPAGAEPAQALTVTLTHSGSASEGDDYAVGTLTIAGGTGSGETTLRAVDDDLDEGNEAITLTAAAPTYRDSPPLSLDLTDDDTSGVSIAPTAVAVDEGGEASYQVVLTSEPFADVTVSLTHSGDADVTADSAALTFTAADWNTAQTVTVSAAHDATGRDDAAGFAHSVTSGDAAYAALTPEAVAVTVTDDDTPGVRVSPTTLRIPEGGSRPYTLALNSEPYGEVGIDIALEGDPDVTIDAATLTFDAGNWNQAQVITVSGARDADASDDQATLAHAVTSHDADYDGVAAEGVSITVSEPNRGGFDGGVTETAEPGVTVSPPRLRIEEGASDRYEVVLESRPAADVVIAISREGDEDVATVREELVFTPSIWDQPQSVEVAAAQDPDAVDDEAVFSHTVTSSDARYHELAAGGVQVEVEDDDSVGVIIQPVTLTVDEEDHNSYTVVLTSQPAAEVTVQLTRRGDADVSVDAEALRFAPEAWNQVRRVTVAAAADEDATNDRAGVDHGVSSPDPTYDQLPAATVEVEVIDDDDAGVVVEPTGLRINEGADRPYAIMLRSRPAAPVKVTLVPSGAEAMTMEADSIEIVPEKWKEPHTVMISAGQDDDAADDFATVIHEVASPDGVYDGMAAEALAVEIVDDDDPGVTIKPNPRIAVDEGGSGAYTVELDSEPVAAVEVTIESDNPDVEPSPPRLGFDAENWNQPQTVTVTVGEDQDSEDESAVMTHRAASEDPLYDQIDIRRLTVEVTDTSAGEVQESLRVMLAGLAGAHAESVQTALEARFERRRQLDRTARADSRPTGQAARPASLARRARTPTTMLDALSMVSRGSRASPRRSASFTAPLAKRQQDFKLIPVLWGHGDLQRFGGRGPDLGYDGGLSLAHVGLDLLSTGKALLGISLARSGGGADYTDRSSGRLTASLSTLQPYLFVKPHQRLTLWGIAGVGGVGIDLLDPRLFYHGHGSFRMGSGGARAKIAARGDTEFAVRVDGFHAAISMRPTAKIGAVTGTANRSRVMMEVVHRLRWGEKSVSVKSEAGGRCDTGDAGQGCGAEVGGRVGFSDPASGLDFAVHGRSLVQGISGYRDWGFGAQMSWDPGLKHNGLRIALNASQGQDGRGRTSIWNGSTDRWGSMGLGQVARLRPGRRTEGEVTYGLDVMGGRGLLTPYSRLDLGGSGRALRWGAEMNLAGRSEDSRPFLFNLESTRRTPASAPGKMGVAFRMSIPF